MRKEGVLIAACSKGSPSAAVRVPETPRHTGGVCHCSMWILKQTSCHLSGRLDAWSCPSYSMQMHAYMCLQATWHGHLCLLSVTMMVTETTSETSSAALAGRRVPSMSTSIIEQDCKGHCSSMLHGGDYDSHP